MSYGAQYEMGSGYGGRSGGGYDGRGVVGYGAGRGSSRQSRGGSGQLRGRGRGRGGFGDNKKFNTRKIFVGGVSKRDTTSESFEKFFQKFGEVEDIILMKSKDGYDGHRGFGFVTFKDQAVTDSVLAQNGELELDGRDIDMKMALPPELNPPEGTDGKKLFIGSLPKENFSSDDLKEYFGQWGTLTDSWVSEGRGFGFVTYEKCNGAYKALIQGLNSGHSVRGDMQLDVKWATPKPNRSRARASYGTPIVDGYSRGPEYGGRATGYGGLNPSLRRERGTYGPSIVDGYSRGAEYGGRAGYGRGMGSVQQSYGGYRSGDYTIRRGSQGRGRQRYHQPY